MKQNALRFVSALTFAIAATSGFAQTAPAGTVEAKDVKTWIINVDGKDYEARPITPTFSGDTGLFHLPSAYTLAKGKSAFSIYRMNLDRNPRDLDATTLGLSFAYGVSSKLEIFGTFGAQRNGVDILTQPGFVNDFPRFTSTWPVWGKK